MVQPFEIQVLTNSPAQGKSGKRMSMVLFLLFERRVN